MGCDDWCSQRFMFTFLGEILDNLPGIACRIYRK